MTVNQLPPQAFSKDTLSKAFQWLMGQSPHIKELATSPDLLISLYQKAQLHGDEALERPSIQNFKNELKNLAGMMNELQPNVGLYQHQQPAPQPQTQQPVQNHTYGPAATSQNYVPPQKINPETNSNSLPQLDAKSLSMIQEVKEQLNLSSDQEALRVVISIGFSKVKKIIS